MKSIILILISQLITICLSQNLRQNKKNTYELLYTSSSLISSVSFSSLNTQLSNVYLPLITSGGPLGYNGPLGPFGPLGTLGPVGSNTWNPSQLISGIEWSSFSSELTAQDGPLSQNGPLGHKGPLNNNLYNGENYSFDSNGFFQQLTGLGLFASLGPLGPLGVLGLLGPLGPVGAHGFKADRDGQYINYQGQIQKEIVVKYDDQSSRKYELFEVYQSSFAKANFNVLDTSFMIQGSFGMFGSQKDQFTFTSNSDQFVTIILIPEKSLDSFKLSLLDVQSNLIDSASNSGLIEHFIIQMKKGQQLTIQVDLQISMQFFSKSYRLIVVGSTAHNNFNKVNGSHVKKYNITTQFNQF
ncbi:hypothetical protein TTHERM_00979900 (macronuclear) [Tetrahymena thermophila SB210]|uniref:Transmembrane protein n=1 Tax=Tetrahymena thermophila (strain SB210) TaxID=312017 RepID=Q23JG7_TETTS|nr:hypothetical protein TTHERM_00979900 [Tetrahymena thermophila SB210]EAR96677.1 hypothetical protein TTHERM_00979900 [Tetrahymena thermophila SB210]|eukprot:XP_001016922.1 hypothetical protein TTHERM_00979900 [Tetrahymena thermophila SB210]